MKWDIDIVNGPQWHQALQKKAERLNRDLSNIVAKTAKDVHKDAAMLTPVRTGDLRKGWASRETGKWEWTVDDEVEYAGFVEYGTSRFAGRYMLNTSCERNWPNMKTAVAEALRRAAHE
jgi:hypothetical protein